MSKQCDSALWLVVFTQVSLCTSANLETIESVNRHHPIPNSQLARKMNYSPIFDDAVMKWWSSAVFQVHLESSDSWQIGSPVIIHQNSISVSLNKVMEMAAPTVSIETRCFSVRGKMADDAGFLQGPSSAIFLFPPQNGRLSLFLGPFHCQLKVKWTRPMLRHNSFLSNKLIKLSGV